MENISLNSNSALDVTIIPNAFIDNYMPNANGAYVKVYLHLLRCLSSSHSNNLSISGIADDLDHTENDIIRALCYWEKVNVLTLMRNPSNQIVGITFNSLDNNANSNINNTMDTNVSNNMNMINQSKSNNIANSNPTSMRRSINNVTNINTRKVAPTSLADAINQEYSSIIPTDNKDIEFVLSIAEKYIERILTPHDEQLILYLYTKANFSSDLILELYEYCASMNKKNYKYIEAVAEAWIKNGINTVDKAKNTIQTFNPCYSAITKEFGITRQLGQAEKNFIDKWLNTYSFDISIIKEACKKTLLTIQKPDFKYTEGILSSWYNNNVKTLDDIVELEKKHNAKFFNNTSTRSSKKQTKSTNRFNNFTQRNYSKEDFEELEKSYFS